MEVDEMQWNFNIDTKREQNKKEQDMTTQDKRRTLQMAENVKNGNFFLFLLLLTGIREKIERNKVSIILYNKK